ncbi:hypothetical protein ACFQJD_06315 [Haloplanus sp. GCM10025708]|uniref:hypothetical protein n=1 Tax=Haloferacaceae TaxID=1644056 RepID=UPI003612A564
MTADVWSDVRERCERRPTLVTPATDRQFTVRDARENRVDVRFADGSERALWREQFELLAERIRTDSAGVSLSDLPPGVEPYVAVLSLLPAYAVDDDALRAVEEPSPGSPFTVEREERTGFDRLRADTLLLRQLLERRDVDVDRLDDLSTDALVDLYVLLSDVHREADDLRRTTGDELLDRTDGDSLRGRFGTVARTERERRHLKDEEDVLSALDEEGIPHEWVLGIDREKLDVVLAVTDLDSDAVYDVETQVYAQKTSVSEEAKERRLGGLRDRLAATDEAAAEEIRDELDELERRIDELLAD